MMINELERYGRKRSWPNLKYYPSMCLEGLRKTMKNLSQENQSLGCNLNPGPTDTLQEC
jgi:hypothetical protein